jgi:hypothetical protein
VPEESQQISPNAFQSTIPGIVQSTGHACRACGTAISPVATFCPHCGARAENTSPSSAAPHATATGFALLGKVLIAVVLTAVLLVVGFVLFYVVVLGVALASCIFNPNPGQTATVTPVWVWMLYASFIAGMFCIWLIVMLKMFK